MAERSQRYFVTLLGFAFAAAWFAIGFEAALGCLGASAVAYLLATTRQRRAREGRASVGATRSRLESSLSRLGQSTPRSPSRAATAVRRPGTGEGSALTPNPVLGSPSGQDPGPYGW
jgi:hypothetical protein